MVVYDTETGFMKPMGWIDQMDRYFFPSSRDLKFCQDFNEAHSEHSPMQIEANNEDDVWIENINIICHDRLENERGPRLEGTHSATLSPMIMGLVRTLLEDFEGGAISLPEYARRLGALAEDATIEPIIAQIGNQSDNVEHIDENADIIDLEKDAEEQDEE
ncbi:uncharacterized protein LOC116215634 [Punica granatum]|uniref:Uncharacterized protein LOC116215634 n=1 Tax=Punica granatum TaxID=22663 RepID=A0A6P8ELP8_PUNGR|nr:uncharacterized protein LOC116215634 [Punica granatum]